MKPIKYQNIKKNASQKGCFLVLFLLLSGIVRPQNQLDIIQHWKQHSDAPNSLYHHIVEQAYVLLKQRNDTVAGLQSLSDWQSRQKTVKGLLTDMVGPFPQKTPLNAKIVGKIDKGTYRVEHIVYESQPGLYVTSSLFVPKGTKNKKFPAIIYCSGHDPEGYHGNYQKIILNLVKKGFIVFAFDPIDQGERLEVDDRKIKTFELSGWHSYAGAQALAIGSSQAKYMIWDGIRAVDYLLGRKEIDPNRIGITGRSGGGTQSSQIAALDNRIYAAAPENYITNFTRLFQSIGPQDAEQNLYQSILQGIDHADLLSVRAPKPTLIIGTTEDIFSIQGFRETAEEVSGIYRAYGAADNFTAVEDVFIHGSTKKNNEAMYAFFQKHLDNTGSPQEEDVEFLNANEIRVTSTGQVFSSLGGKTIFDINLTEAEREIDQLQISRKDLSAHLNKVLVSAKTLSGFIKPTKMEGSVFVGRMEREGYVVDKYFVKGEGDYIIPYLLMVPDVSNKKALLYLHPSGKSAEAFEGGEMEWFVKRGFTVLAPDMIGIGEMGPVDLPQGSNIANVSYSVWSAAMLVGRSILGIRAGDVMRLTSILANDKNMDQIYGVAQKEMAPLLLHAAAFDSRLDAIALVAPYSSYSSLVLNRYYDPKFVHSIVPGALTEYDLPDLAATLAPRKLLMTHMTDGNGKPMDSLEIHREMDIVKKTYRQKEASHQLEIKLLETKGDSNNMFSKWIK